MAADNTELVNSVKAMSARLGISPSDVLTAMSYETGGTLNPWAPGPTTQWGQHRGLIQWGEPQRAKYGVTRDSTIPEQVDAVGNYLTDAGVRPGHGLLDIYSAINAGRVGLYNRSDANNGGAPGTVADKVAGQMYGHRLRANALLGTTGDELGAGGEGASGAAPTAGTTSPDTTAATPADDTDSLSAFMPAYRAATAQTAAPAPPTPNFDFRMPPTIEKVRRLVEAMRNRPLRMT